MLRKNQLIPRYKRALKISRRRAFLSTASAASCRLACSLIACANERAMYVLRLAARETLWRYEAGRVVPPLDSEERHAGAA